MSINQHVLTAAVGAVTTPSIVSTIEAPDTNDKIVALASSIVVQSLIFGLMELRKWLTRKKKEKAIEVETPPAL